jgi:hypothetical protein
VWWVIYSFQDSEAQRSCSEICPAAVARGDQPPEPKSRDLHEAPTPTDGLRVMAELARPGAALQAKAGGGGAANLKGRRSRVRVQARERVLGATRRFPSGCYLPRDGGKGGRTGPRGAPIRSPLLLLLLGMY